LTVDAGEHRSADRQETDLIGRLLDLIALRDPETATHSRRIGPHSARLADLFGLSGSRGQMIGLAAPLHDIGKLAIPDAILLKSGSLSFIEKALMRCHPQIGYHLLSGSECPALDVAAEIALTHHEWFDGSGYPQGLVGEEIPIGGRIVAITDAFDVLISDRPYRQGTSAARASKALLLARARHFDPALLDLFRANLATIVTHFGSPATSP
jgi:putative two-component system response regulator